MHFGRQLRSFVSSDSVTFSTLLWSNESSSAALSWTRCQSACSYHSGTRSACSVWLPCSWTSCLRLPSYSAFPLREHGARSAWFLSTLNSSSVESLTDTSISVRRILSSRSAAVSTETVMLLNCERFMECTDFLEPRLRCPCVVSTAHNESWWDCVDRITRLRYENATNCRSLAATSWFPQQVDISTRQNSTCFSQDVSHSNLQENSGFGHSGFLLVPVFTLGSLDWWLNLMAFVASEKIKDSSVRYFVTL